MITTDHSFHIGEQHLKSGKPCQDYALSGVLQSGAAYAIVSDGCSSGGQTDIGARLMALATKRALTELATTLAFPSKAQVSKVNALRDTYLESYRMALGLDHRDLLATCLWAVVDEGHAFYHVSGDGVVVIRYRNCWRMETFDWAKNMPYYPAYQLGGTVESYREALADVAEPFTRTLTGSHGDGIDAIIADTFTINQGMKGWSDWLEMANPTGPGPLTDIALFTDGVAQIDGVDTFDAASRLTWFKSTNGQFAVRRMNRFLAETRKIGRGPFDDIAMAVIHLGEDDTSQT